MLLLYSGHLDSGCKATGSLKLPIVKGSLISPYFERTVFEALFFTEVLVSNNPSIIIILSLLKVFNERVPANVGN